MRGLNWSAKGLNVYLNQKPSKKGDDLLVQFAGNEINKHDQPKELLVFAKEADKSMKTEKDLSDFSQLHKKVIIRLRQLQSLMATQAKIKTKIA